VDEVWTSGRFNKQTFSVSGVNKKIRIISARDINKKEVHLYEKEA